MRVLQRLQLAITVLPNIGREREYERIMNRMLASMRKLAAETMIPQYGRAHAERERELRLDAWPELLESAVSILSMRFGEPLQTAKREMESLAGGIKTSADSAWKRRAWQLVGVDIFKGDTALDELVRSWSQANAKKITSIHDRYLSSVADLSHSYVRQGRTSKAFAAELVKTYDVTKKQAKNIARTEVAKLNGQITKSRQQGMGVREYVWLTSGDERVRPSHKALSGKTCRWDDPTVYKAADGKWRKRANIGGYIGDPGEDYMCRCSARGDVSGALDRILGEAA